LILPQWADVENAQLPDRRMQRRKRVVRCLLPILTAFEQGKGAKATRVEIFDTPGHKKCTEVKEELKVTAAKLILDSGLSDTFARIAPAGVMAWRP
jgi:hypothetical protein